MACLYGAEMNKTFRFGDWDQNHEDGKAEFVLREGAPKNWYWLENPLFKYESATPYPMRESWTDTSAWSRRAHGASWMRSMSCSVALENQRAISRE